MPSIPDEYVPLRVTGPQERDGPAPVDTPSLIETVRAAGTVANWPYRSWRWLENRDGSDFDPTHNPLEMIRGTKYESDPARFATSRDEQETRAIMREWDEDDAAAEVLSRSGRTGTVAAIGMGLIDPTIFMPVAKVFTGVGQGYRALRIAGDVAAASAAGAAIGEGAMAATTPGYKAEDFALGVGSATVLGGLLGGAAGALMSRAERQAVTKALHADREAWGAEIAAERAGTPPAARAAGAAASDTRALTLDTPALLSKLPDPTGKISPPRRVLNSPFTAARRATVDLVETPYIFKENREGVATTQGPALERSAKLETGKARVGLTRQIESAYARYRFGGEAETWRESAAQAMTRMGDMTGRPRDKASIAEFKAMVDDAMRNGDQHAIPEVAETAKWMRANIIAPWRDRAITAGLLPEGVEAGTADSYMIRVWNKQRLIGERPRATQVFADWLEAEEAKKASLQDTLRGLKGEQDAAMAKLADLQGKRNKKLGANAPEIDARMAALEAEVKARGQKIDDVVQRWEGKSARAAQRAMDAGDGAGDAVDTAVRRILSKERIRDRKELESLAGEIVDRITGSPDGRLPYDAHMGRDKVRGAARTDARGPLAAREFMIPDALVRDFIDTDAQNTAEIYLNTMVPDVLLTERFGDVRMTETFRKINEEAAGLELAAKTPAERAAIHAQRDTAIADLAAMRDRVRHAYGWSSDPRQRFLGRMAMTLGRYDILTNLGGAALSSISDIAGIQWRHGMTSAFKNAFVPFAKAMVNAETRKAVIAQKRQLQALGIAAETYLATRAHSLHDVTDVYRPTTRFERGIQFATEKFQKVSLLAQWTDFSKLAAGMVSSSEISRAAEKMVAGTASARQVRNMAEAGIDAAMAARIDAALKAPGGSDVIDGIRIPNTGDWTDIGAREAFEGALARDVDIMIITPGAEKPLMMSKPIAALILQYKSFVTAANERLLVRSLQARDRQVLEGMVGAIGLGILAEYAYSGIVGRDMPSRPADMIKAGVTRSGILGWYQEANALSEKWFDLDGFAAIGAKRPDSRYISRETLTAALGPTAGKVEALIKTGRNVADLNWTATDTRRMRRMLIGQNLFYIRALLDKIEEGGNTVAGIEPLPGNR